MARLRATHDAVVVGTIVFWCAYAVPLLFEVPLLWYLPLARGWVFTIKPSVLGMSWYGLTGQAMLLGVIAGGVTGLASRKDVPVSPGRARASAVAIGAAAVIVAGLYVHELVNRRPVPEPLPPSYVPR